MTEERWNELRRQMQADILAEDCAVISTNGYRIRATFCGQPLPVPDEIGEAIDAVYAECNEQQYWPNVYFVNDHGNVSLLDRTGQTIASWV